MLILGLTGGIATGKSTVSKYLREKHGITIVDADVIAREVVEPGTKGYRRIVDHFSPLCDDLLQEDGQLNRPALGRVIFGNEKERQFLNSVIHPAVRYESLRQVLVAWLRGNKIVVMDVPLLFESNFSAFCGATMAVVCDDKIELQRLLARDTHLTEKDARERIASQMPLDKKRELADFVIENDKDLTHLYNEVDITLAKITPGSLLTYAEWLIPPFGVLMAIYTYLSRRKRAKPVAKL